MGCVYRSTREVPLVPVYLHGRGSGSPGFSPVPPYPLKSMGLEDLPTWGPHVLMLEKRGSMPMRMLMEPIENHTPKKKMKKKGKKERKFTRSHMSGCLTNGGCRRGAQILHIHGPMGFKEAPGPPCDSWQSHPWNSGPISLLTVSGAVSGLRSPVCRRRPTHNGHDVGGSGEGLRET